MHIIVQRRDELSKKCGCQVMDDGCSGMMPVALDLKVHQGKILEQAGMFLLMFDMSDRLAFYIIDDIPCVPFRLEHFVDESA